MHFKHVCYCCWLTIVCSFFQRLRPAETRRSKCLRGYRSQGISDDHFGPLVPAVLRCISWQRNAIFDRIFHGYSSPRHHAASDEHGQLLFIHEQLPQPNYIFSPKANFQEANNTDCYCPESEAANSSLASARTSVQYAEERCAVYRNSLPKS